MVGGHPLTRAHGGASQRRGVHRGLGASPRNAVDIGAMYGRPYATRGAGGQRPGGGADLCGLQVAFRDPLDGEEVLFSGVDGGGCRYRVQGKWRPLLTKAELQRDASGLFLYFRELDRGVAVTARAVEDLVVLFDDNDVEHNIDTFDELQIAIRKANARLAREPQQQQLSPAYDADAELTFLQEAEERYKALVARQGVLSPTSPGVVSVFAPHVTGSSPPGRGAPVALFEQHSTIAVARSSSGGSSATGGGGAGGARGVVLSGQSAALHRPAEVVGAPRLVRRTSSSSTRVSDAARGRPRSKSPVSTPDSAGLRGGVLVGRGGLRGGDVPEAAQSPRPQPPTPLRGSRLDSEVRDLLRRGPAIGRRSPPPPEQAQQLPQWGGGGFPGAASSRISPPRSPRGPVTFYD